MPLGTLWEECNEVKVHRKNTKGGQKLSDAAGYKISENDMVLQLATSLGATGLINEEYKAWKKKSITNHTLRNSKAHFHEALEEARGIKS